MLSPIDARPSHWVGVVGKGSLGHLALQFLSKWGCGIGQNELRERRPKMTSAECHRG